MVLNRMAGAMNFAMRPTQMPPAPSNRGIRPPTVIIPQPTNSNNNNNIASNTTNLHGRRRDLLVSTPIALILSTATTSDAANADPELELEGREEATDTTASTTSATAEGEEEEVATTMQQQSEIRRTSCSELVVTQRVFMEVSINGKLAGRIVIGLFGEDVPSGVNRFSDLVTGKAGASYRRKEFVKIMPNYIQNDGLRSYGVDAEMLSSSKGGDVAGLLEEREHLKERCAAEADASGDGIRNRRGSVGIVIRDPSKPPPELKLVAKQGKLEIKEEEARGNPNGTMFTIATKDAPELDDTTLLVGRVLDGWEVVDIISKVETVQDNTSSPYFRVAKLIGDKRAVVAERGFNRPYSKIVITRCGLIE
ncbi:hypothetical protein AMTRI_Chr04g179680 [Amborella trichopoda]|uniref:PPIase cyclophilin-type domain-containing protein n=1 Tax=Amborella trichopoda TaxID=13333 RepID=W1PUH0_AMBTC|nr:peptidyl-prolyl cis-trans isomerase CYP26-2, chloroplastic [Amborella trichopoda]ERN11351.1 hypothetical protein AMTR_s00024p00252620 [Amborella trichopoda]|eukprot:XP_006849770.3 peptidyl-prolyl cis-trans isomerase CYP26-2, chloroplastic [Amborella trichopoda]